MIENRKEPYLFGPIGTDVITLALAFGNAERYCKENGIAGTFGRKERGDLLQIADTGGTAIGALFSTASGCTDADAPSAVFLDSARDWADVLPGNEFSTRVIGGLHAASVHSGNLRESGAQDGGAGALLWSDFVRNSLAGYIHSLWGYLALSGKYGLFQYSMRQVDRYIGSIARRAVNVAMAELERVEGCGAAIVPGFLVGVD